MACYSRNNFTDVPTMIMSPTDDAQLSYRDLQSLPFSTTVESRESPLTKSYHNNSTSWTPADKMSPIYTNPSHKRLRDEADLTSNHDGSCLLLQQANIPEPSQEQHIYGKAMGALSPPTGVAISAKSQNGRWHEEKAETNLRPSPTPNQRPKLPPSRKSVRLDLTAPSTPRLDDDACAVAPASSSKSSMSDPAIDDFTYALGIGWTRLASGDPDIQAAARGWVRYLENHYSNHIHGAEILLQSKGLNAYLVKSEEGFYLFREDLLEGRLVGRNWNTCWNNLRTHPIAFERDEALRAERTPVPDVGVAVETNGSNVRNKNINYGNDAGFNGCMDLD